MRCISVRFRKLDQIKQKFNSNSQEKIENPLYSPLLNFPLSSCIWFLNFYSDSCTLLGLIVISSYENWVIAMNTSSPANSSISTAAVAGRCTTNAAMSLDDFRFPANLISVPERKDEAMTGLFPFHNLVRVSTFVPSCKSVSVFFFCHLRFFSL